MVISHLEPKSLYPQPTPCILQSGETKMKSKARVEAGRRNGLLARGKKSEEARQK
jgi:hypothetical protein